MKTKKKSTKNKLDKRQKLTEQEKVQQLYNLIGERGLYVNTNYDVFTHTPENINISPQYKVPLIKEGRAFDSPLLFATLTALLNQGTMLAFGTKGAGKTTSAEYAGHFIRQVSMNEILEAEIQGNPDLRKEEYIASLDTVKMFHGGRKVILPAKFFECPVKIWDEVNRNPADTLSASMKLIDIGKATYQGKLLISPPSMVISTANYEDEGTFQLTAPFIDRHDVAVMVTSPPFWDLKKIRERGDEKLNGNLDELLSIPNHLKLNHSKIRKEINDLEEDVVDNLPSVSSFADFLYASLRFSEAASPSLIRATKGNAPRMNDEEHQGHFTSGTGDYTFVLTNDELSVRTIQAMNRYAKSFAWLQGKQKVELTDLKTVLPYLLWHKLEPTKSEKKKEPRYENDRIGFVDYLIRKVENEYTKARADTIEDTPVMELYTFALDTIRNGESGKEKIDESTLRNIIGNTCSKIGKVDKPYALMLGQHLSSEYNAEFMRKQKSNRKITRGV